jgi:hypothetical protein
LESSDPLEITDHVMYLRQHPEESTRIRKEARRSARQFTWEAAARNLIRKLENQANIQDIIGGNSGPDPIAPFKIAASTMRREPHLRDEPPDRPPTPPVSA